MEHMDMKDWTLDQLLQPLVHQSRVHDKLLKEIKEKIFQPEMKLSKKRLFENNFSLTKNLFKDQSVRYFILQKQQNHKPK